MARISLFAYDACSNLPIDNVDWFQIEVAYRYGLESLERIGMEQGISIDFIQKKAEQEGWPRPATDYSHT
jgi:hypothetical protein